MDLLECAVPALALSGAQVLTVCVKILEMHWALMEMGLREYGGVTNAPLRSCLDYLKQR